jgi:hypothetical protein
MRWLLRAVVTAHLADVFAQPVMAGRFMSGDYDLLAVHRANAISAAVVGFTQLAVAFLYWRVVRGPGWPALVCLGLSAAEGLQIYLGFNRILGLHVPLGVAIIAISAVLAAVVWRPGFGGAVPST